MILLANLIARIAMRLGQAVAITIVVALVLLVAVLGLVRMQLGRIQQSLAPMVQHQLEATLGRAVRVGGVELHGLNEVVIRDTTVARGLSFDQGTALTAPRTVAQLDLFSLLWTRGQRPLEAIRGITLQNPVLAVVRNIQGKWDFQDILDRMRMRPAEAAEWTAPVTVENASVSYNDAHGFGGSPIDKQLVAVHASVLPLGQRSYRFDVSAEDAQHEVGRVRVAGDYVDRKGTTAVSVSANSMAVKELSRYLPANLPIIFENGTAALRASAVFSALPSPQSAGQISPSALTAEVDLTGVGLRLRELTTPIVASSGRLRLVHDQARYPNGSRLDLVDVRGRAGDVPMRFDGSINNINLFDLAHLNPQFDIRAEAATPDGAAVTRLFPDGRWPAQISLAGPLNLAARLSGPARDLHIDGSLRAEHLGVQEAHGEGLDVAFHLRPGADGVTTPSIEATARARRAVFADAAAEGLTVGITSATPWRDLEDRPKVEGSVTTHHITSPWGAADDVSSHVVAGRDAVSLTGLQARIFSGQVRGDVTLPLVLKGEQPTEALHAAATYEGVDLSQVAKLLHVSKLTGTGRGTLTLGISPQSVISLDTDVQGSGLQYDGYQATTAQARVHAVADHGALQVAIPHATAQTDAGDFTVTGGSYQRTAAQPAEGTLALPLHGERIPLHRFSDKATGTATVDGQVSGTLAAPALTGHVTAAQGDILGRRFDTAEAQMTYHAGDLRFRDIALARPGLVLTSTGGPQGIDPRQGKEGLAGVTGTVTAHGASLADVLNLAGVESPWQVDGPVTGSAQISYADGDIHLDGDAAIAGAVVHIPLHDDQESYTLPTDRLGLNFALHGKMMQVRELRVDRGGTTVRAQGTAGIVGDTPFAVDLAFQGEHARLQDLPLDLFGVPMALDGPVQAAGTLRGVLNGTGPEPLTVQVTGDAPLLQAEGIPVGAGNIDLTYQYRPDSRLLTINHSTVRNAAFVLAHQGQHDLTQGRMSGVCLDVDQINLPALRTMMAGLAKDEWLAQIAGALSALPAQLTGQGALHLTADGPYATPDLRLTADASGLAVAGTPLPNVHAVLASTRTHGRYGLRIEEAVARGGNGEGQASVSGLVEPAGNLDLQIAAQGITGKVLAPYVGALPVDGSLGLTATVRGPWTAPTVDGDVRVDRPQYAGRALDFVAGHVNLTGERLALTNGQLSLAPGTQPLTAAGQVPVRWAGPLHPTLAMDQPLALQLALPKQDLTALRALAPELPNLQVTAEGNVQVGGTPAAPVLTDGAVTLAGQIDLPRMDADFPNRLADIDVRLRLAGTPARSHVTIERFSATLDRVVGGARAQGFTPGWVAAQGAVDVPLDALSTPDRWQWDVYAQALRVPLAARIFMVPQVSGFVHLVTDSTGASVLNGLVYADHVTLKQPKIPEGTAQAWGPFSFNPRLSVVLQAGEKVKLAKSIFRIPLRVTPLAMPPVPDAQATAPSLAIDPTQPVFATTADTLRPGTANEVGGTWGVVTGSLDDPRIYARFEVDKDRLSFPLNLIGSVRNAKGHITYSLADGMKMEMGIKPIITEQPLPPPDAAPADGQTVPAPTGDPSVPEPTAEQPAA